MNVTVKSLIAFITWYKRTSPCADCGLFYHPACMDLDHIPERGKKTGVVKVFAKNRDPFGLWLELSKCDVICANCHRLRTVKRGTSDEAKAKISKGNKGKKKTLRWPRSETHKITEERKAALSEFQKRRPRTYSASQAEKLKAKWADPEFRNLMKIKGNGKRGPGKKSKQ